MCAVNRVIRLTTSLRESLLVMACIVYGVGWAMEVTQLIRLRASERHRRMLRNKVEADHICMFCTSLLQELYTSPNSRPGEKQTLKK